ncbi:hypothetical protein MBANPS3_000415 [Mucor bainieri]
MATRNFTFHIFSLPQIQNTHYTCNFCNRAILLGSTVLATKEERSSVVKVNHWACERHHLPNSFVEARQLNKCDIDLGHPRLAAATLVEVMNAVANPPAPAPAPQQAEEQPAEPAPQPAMEPLVEVPREVVPYQERYYEWYRQYLNEIQERSDEALPDMPPFIADHLESIVFDEEDVRNLDQIATLREEVISTPLRPNGAMAISLDQRMDRHNRLNATQIVTDITEARSQRLYAIEDALQLRLLTADVNEANNAESQDTDDGTQSSDDN